MKQIFSFSILLISLLALNSCDIKDSAFGTEVKISRPWNSKFQIPYVNVAGGETARFAIITDSHQNYADLRETIRTINRSGAQFAIHAGDFTDIGSRDEYEIFLEYIKELKIPLYVGSGNHDLTGAGRGLYKKVFGPENQVIETDYAKFIFWNNNAQEIKPDIVNLEFLDFQVSSTARSKHLFIFQHQDPYNKISLTKVQQKVYSSMLTSRSQTLVFHGHLHQFSKMQQGGAHYFQIARIEGARWGMVEVNDTSVKVYYCKKSSCQLQDSL